MTKEKYVPTEEDKEWLKKTLSLVKDGAIWLTDYAMYRKRGNTLVCTRSILDFAPNAGINEIDVEKNIAKDGAVAKSIGMEFKDMRLTKYN